MKKLSIFLLALIGCTGTIFASDTEVNGIWYDFDSSTKTASVTYRGSYSYDFLDEYSGEIVIPALVSYNKEEYIVTSIGNGAFAGCSGLTSLTIPNSVTSIGGGAFAGCSGLTSVTIPNSVTSIGYDAFSGCSGLTSVTIGNSVTSIGDYAFYGCTGLTSVTIPNSVTNIGIEAFWDCTGLTSIEIPNSVTSIGDYAFYYCTGLTKVNITDIAAWCNIAFSYVESNPLFYAKHLYLNDVEVTDLTIPNSVTSIGKYAFYNCSGLTSVTIPNSVTSIGEHAFQGCSGLTSIEIPNSVTSIGNWVFEYCTGLTSVTIGNSVTSIAEDAFNDCSNITKVTWNAKKCNGYNFGPQVNSFRFGNKVEEIPDNLCYGMNKLPYIEIPSSVTSIGRSAFSGCSGLTSIEIPNSVTSIGEWAFNDCSNITVVIWNAKKCNGYNFGPQVESFWFGNEVEEIPANLCYGMNKLTSITIPNSVTNIGIEAFSGCSGLTKVKITDIAAWCNIAFSSSYSNPLYYAKHLYLNNVEVTDLTIPNSVTGIGDYAFYNCTSLTSVTIPNSVTSIGNGAFEYCTGLTSVTIGNSVTSIGDYAFEYCSGLTKVNITDIAAWCNIAFSSYDSNPLYYAKHLYLNDVEVTDLTIPNSVTGIGDYAFYNCSGLTSVTIPSSVTSIGNYAFHGCRGLTIVEAPSMFFDIEESQWPYYTKSLSNVKVNSSELTENALQFINRSYKTLQTLDVSGVTNTEFADEAFSGYYNLTELKLPQGLTTVSYMMVAGCKNLESISIPETVTEIDQSAFEDCRSITSVDFGENPTLTKIGSWAFYNCHELANIDIPEGVTEIDKAAFYGCAYAKAAHLPASLQYIGDNGFALCSKLTQMTVDAVTPPEVENKTFYEVSTEAPVYVPDYSVSSYKSHPVWGKLNIVGRGDAPTEVDNVQGNNTKATKILRDGQIYIMRNGTMYNIQGNVVK